MAIGDSRERFPFLVVLHSSIHTNRCFRGVAVHTAIFIRYNIVEKRRYTGFSKLIYRLTKLVFVLSVRWNIMIIIDEFIFLIWTMARAHSTAVVLTVSLRGMGSGIYYRGCFGPKNARTRVCMYAYVYTCVFTCRKRY